MLKRVKTNVQSINNILMLSQRPVHLSMLSWYFFYWNSSQYSSHVTMSSEQWPAIRTESNPIEMTTLHLRNMISSFNYANLHAILTMIYLPRMFFLEQKPIYHGYFSNMNAFSAGKRHILRRSQHDS